MRQPLTWLTWLLPSAHPPTNTKTDTHQPTNPRTDLTAAHITTRSDLTRRPPVLPSAPECATNISALSSAPWCTHCLLRYYFQLQLVCQLKHEAFLICEPRASVAGTREDVLYKSVTFYVLLAC